VSVGAGPEFGTLVVHGVGVPRVPGAREMAPGPTCSATHWCEPFAVSLTAEAKNLSTNGVLEADKPSDDELRSTGRLDTVPGVSSPGSPRESPGGISGYAVPPRVPAHAAPPQGHLCNAAQRLPTSSRKQDTRLADRVQRGSKFTCNVCEAYDGRTVTHG
jgi:hypothetical protein